MSATPVETIPATWDASRDVPFFRITADLFSADFCVLASLLLGSFDDGRAATASADTEQPTAAAQPDLVPVPVRLRRTR